MKKISLIAIFSASLFVLSCKPKTGSNESADSKKDSTATQQTASPTTATPPATTTPANAPKTYTVTFTPDTAILGKKQEAAIKVTPVGATDLSDPDGKSQGIELTFKVTLTNKNKIGGNSIGVAPSDFRLVLDNNTSISQASGSYVSAEPESTKESEVITYRIPAGAKPKALNLFYDETRATVQVSLK
ncbi:hypothetical protein SAMN05216464_10364 [Mucilaginibacter pineti]|uniref:DUF4352 domain-containing protein n=1 Tax=Mucilaginibacter pineti TaxID=1391627 RepID=A0A1G6YRR5_9SPHI|nr:hypothetical protein [Mucilaginibacter pineti]SDD92723.1 hypothetical protein SAMN05216464_10364 [Mucilaginibacter pineti]